MRMYVQREFQIRRTNRQHRDVDRRASDRRETTSMRSESNNRAQAAGEIQADVAVAVGSGS